MGLGEVMEREGRRMGVRETLEWLGEGLRGGMEGRGWEVKEVDLEEVEGYVEQKHDRVLKVLDWKEEMERIEREQKAKQHNVKSIKINLSG